MPSYLGRNLSIILVKQILIFNVILFSISPRSLDWKPKECAAIVMINNVLYSEWCASVKVHPKVCGVDSILIENWILHTNAIGKVGKANIFQSAMVSVLSIRYQSGMSVNCKWVWPDQRKVQMEMRKVFKPKQWRKTRGRQGLQWHRIQWIEEVKF